MNRVVDSTESLRISARNIQRDVVDRYDTRSSVGSACDVEQCADACTSLEYSKQRDLVGGEGVATVVLQAKRCVGSETAGGDADRTAPRLSPAKGWSTRRTPQGYDRATFGSSRCHSVVRVTSHRLASRTGRPRAALHDLAHVRFHLPSGWHGPRAAAGQAVRIPCPMWPRALEELEARVAALEAERVDYRAVLAAVNARWAQIKANLRETSGPSSSVSGCQEHIGTVESELHTHGGYLRSLNEGQAELKDLLIRALDTSRVALEGLVQIRSRTSRMITPGVFRARSPNRYACRQSSVQAQTPQRQSFCPSALACQSSSATVALAAFHS